MNLPETPDGQAARETTASVPGNERPLRSISSMATRGLLAELAEAYQDETGRRVSLEAVGGVDAARRIANGEVFDVVVLAREAVAKLAADGHLRPGSEVELVRSGVAVAVRAGAPRPDVGTVEALERALRDARTIGYSTGPSGVALAELFRRWGLADELRDRIVTPPPGVPVGTLVANGAVALGFQQRSELIHLAGIEVIGDLPAELGIVTVFSGAIGLHARELEAARAWLTYLASPAATPAKRRHGLEPA